ncbi:MAG: hypothetical protein KJO98_08555, partial [Rhodothermia bacterium]|nr:hypothetical protein [Rhodothermia bacterium]
MHRFYLYLAFAVVLAAFACGAPASTAQPAMQFEPRLDAPTRESDPGSAHSSASATASGSVLQCLGRGKVSGSVLSHIDFGSRALQREVFQGSLAGAPAAGTIVRFYSDPVEFMGDFDSNGSSDTVRAVTEVVGPGGADPCPSGPNSGGCMMGERIVEEPFMSGSGEWTIPAELPITRSEGSIPAFAPNTFEIRFTETGSLAYQGFTSGRIVRFP